MRKTILLVVVALFFGGCGSARYASTLKPTNDPKRTLGEPYRIVSVKVDRQGGVAAGWHGLTPDAVAAEAKRRYPAIFVDRFDAVPVVADVKGVFHDQSFVGALLTGFTLGVIPFPSTQRSDLSVSVELLDERGERKRSEPVRFVREDSLWMSIVGPLGCIPIPGDSDLPRDTVFLLIGADSSSPKTRELTLASTVEAIVEGIGKIDPRQRHALASARRSRIREIELEGKRYRSVIAPAFSKGFDKQEKPDLYQALLFDGEPLTTARPVEVLTVARRDEGGKWVPVTAYPRKAARRLIAINALQEDGVPARLVATEVTEPPLEDFVTIALAGPDDAGRADEIRWNNRILLEIKNKSLAGWLAARSTPEVLDVVTRMEQAILDIDRESDLAKDRAVTLSQDGKDVTAVRELTLAYRERAEILKALLSILKQQLQRRPAG